MLKHSKWQSEDQEMKLEEETGSVLESMERTLSFKEHWEAIEEFK